MDGKGLQKEALMSMSFPSIREGCLRSHLYANWRGN